jgi:hypothetical protein
MSRQSWAELLAWLTADATALANTTTEGSIVPNTTIPANYMADGRCLRARVFGKLSTTGTPTMTFAVRWGGAAGTLLATTEVLTMGSGVTNVNFDLEVYIQTRANGAAGSLMVSGTCRVHTAAGTVLLNVFSVSGYDAPAPVTVDLTANADLAITGDWSAASASNTLTVHGYTLEALN